MTTSTVSSGQSIANLVANGGTIYAVQNGGTIVTATIASGGSAVISSGGLATSALIQSSGAVTVSSGGVDSAATIQAGGSELVYGSASLDVISGTQIVSSSGAAGGAVTSETIASGGVLSMAIKGTTVSNITVLSGGSFGLNGAISAANTVLSGGTVVLSSAKAALTSSLVFNGGTLLVTGNTSAGSGDLALISGFAAGDVIDMAAATTIGAAASATLALTSTGSTLSAVVSGGGASDTYLFSGTAIGASLVLVHTASSGWELTIAGAAATVVSGGTTQSNLVVASGGTLEVLSGGTLVAGAVQSGGQLYIFSSGIDSGSVISAGGTESLSGTATGDSVFGIQTLASGGTANSETVQSGGVVTFGATGETGSAITVSSGGTLNVSGGTVTNIVDAGGTVNLGGAPATIAGSFTFNGSGALNISTPSAAGESAVISGFYYGDTVNLPSFGTGATVSFGTASGNTTALVTSGGSSETLTFDGTTTSANLALTSSGGHEAITYVPPPTLSTYTPGDLVLSIYGNGAGTGTVTLDQAAPITLEEITASGAIVGIQVLPETTTVVGGTTEYAISGEYQSASEGLLSLAGNGQSLVIMGYGVSAAAFDAAGASALYGTAALGQSTSLLGGASTTVNRVVADISYNTTVDTSTSLNSIFNTNNPRSVATINGTSFYVSGQSLGADGTEGVFAAADGASTATAIYNTKTDTRDVEIANGQLYVSIDSTQNGGGGLYSVGTGLPTSSVTPTPLAGIGPVSITLGAGQGNTINTASVGSSVNLSPEQYFFANATTLYIADGGVPKEGGVGDGGLQKWSLVGGTWQLDYTLSQGLNLVPTGSASGTTGLIGLTGTVEGSNVVLYASNETAGETDQTYLYGITDTLAATTLPAAESFTLLETAAPGTLIRGVAFAPTSTSTLPQVTSALAIATGVTSSGLTFASGGSASVASGGTISGATLLTTASATIATGGVDLGTYLGSGATELVSGSATSDSIAAVQTVTGAVTSETVLNGGTVILNGATALATTVTTAGTLQLNDLSTATNTVIDGGVLLLQVADATIAGTVTFAGTGGTLIDANRPSAGDGISALVSGLAATDTIDLRGFGTGATLATAASGGNTVATITSGANSQTITLAGLSYLSGLSLTPDGLGDVGLIFTPTTLTVGNGVSSSGITLANGSIVNVQSGGTISAFSLASGGSANIAAGGTDSGSTILAGGTEIVDGAVIGDAVYGLQNVTTGPSAGASAATIANETVYAGGTIELYLKPDTGTNITVSSGGQYLLSGNVSGTNTTIEAGGTVALQSPKAVLNGDFVFSGAATLAVTAIASAGYGDLATISGWGAGDIIDDTVVSSGTATLSLTSAAGVTSATISGGSTPQTYLFAGDQTQNITMVADGGTGVELQYALCYLPGTLIQTDHGEIPIENLRETDRVLTASGHHRPIVWVGRRAYDGRFIKGNKRILPITIQAGALAEGIPARDLTVSPLHAIYLEGVLIDAQHLINGVTITQAETIDTVTYLNIELDTHDVIFANGAAAESFVGDECRNLFANAAEYRALYPTAAFQPVAYHAPRLDHGEAVHRARAGIAHRAGLEPETIATSTAAPPRGSVDRVTAEAVEGWIQCPDTPESRVLVEILQEGIVLGTALANRLRPDLAAAGLGSGRHAFEFTAPAGITLDPETINVRRAIDGAELAPHRERLAA